jgi:hypothetical protein
MILKLGISIGLLLMGFYVIPLLLMYWKIALSSLFWFFILLPLLVLFIWIYWKVLKEYTEKITRITKTILYILLAFLIIFIIISSLWTLFWIIINGYYGINIWLEKWDSIRIIFYIFQLVIVMFWIFVWYLNFRELLRKNQWDHFPAIRVLNNSLNTTCKWRLSTDEKNYHGHRSWINIKFEIENTSKNLVQIELWNIEVTWKSIKWNYRKTKILRSGFSLWPTVYMDISNNLLYEKEKMNVSIYVNPMDGFNCFKKVTCVYINLWVSSYWVKKNVRIWLSNIKEYTDKTKKEKDYKFELKNFIYE